MMLRPTRVAIADDDVEQARSLSTLVAQLRPAWIVQSVATNVFELRRTLEEVVPDVLLLDLHMPGIEPGTNALDLVDGADANPVIVLITGDPSYALQAYDRAISDYIVKPARPTRLNQALSRAEAVLAQRNGAPQPNTPIESGGTRWITGSRGKDIVLVDPDDILYLQAERKYTIAFIENGQILLRRGITEIEAILNKTRFIRIHRSTIVNMSHIEYLRRDEMGRLRLRLKNRSDSLIVSRSFEQAFKEN